MDGFVGLIPVHLLQVFTLPELYVALSAGRSKVRTISYRPAIRLTYCFLVNASTGTGLDCKHAS